jgi:hypothetical protein
MSKREEERNRITEEDSQKIISFLTAILPSEYIDKFSIFKRYFIYIVWSFFKFLLSLLFLFKYIIFLQWSRIPRTFVIIQVVDELIKNHLKI